MIIQHNLMSLNASRTMEINSKAVSKGLEKLSSGYRINRAADDAAGLAVSEKMRAQTTALDRAIANAKDGDSLAQTAEGALSEVHGMLNRLVELATQSANGTLQDGDRVMVERELDALRGEIDRVAQATNFNGIPLLDGHLDKELQPVTYVFQDGTVIPSEDFPTGPINTYLQNYVTVEPGGRLDSLPEAFRTKGTGDITATVSATSPYRLIFSVKDRNGGPDIDYEIDFYNRVDLTDNTAYVLDLSPFGSVPLKNDAGMINVGVRDMARAVAAAINNLNPALSVDPFETTEVRMELVDIDGLILQVGDTSADFNKIAIKIEDISSESLGLNGLSMANQDAAASAIDNIKKAIEKVSVNRGRLGAVQNRLDHTINNLGTTVENITAAESRIRDADMAKEAMNLTKNQVLTQSSQAMLAQANMQPQQVLQLLR